MLGYRYGVCGEWGGCLMVFVVDLCKTILMFSLAQAEQHIRFRIHRSRLFIGDQIILGLLGAIGMVFVVSGVDV